VRYTFAFWLIGHKVELTRETISVSDVNSTILAQQNITDDQRRQLIAILGEPPRDGRRGA